MRKLCLFFFLICVANVSGQDKCSMTFGEIYDFVKSEKFSSEEHLSYKTYTSFDFKAFKPVAGDINFTNYYQIGYSSDGEIREIIHYDSSWHTMVFKVRLFDKSRIMFLQFKDFDNGFAPVAFIVSEKIRLMINFRQMTGKRRYQFGEVAKAPDIRALEDISCIMILNEEFYPTEYFMAHAGYLQMMVDLQYFGSSYQLDKERVHVIFSPQERKGLKLERSLCINTLSYELFTGADLLFTAKPLDYKDKYPLWIYCGVSWFK
jgi:hypothetical protein